MSFTFRSYIFENLSTTRKINNALKKASDLTTTEIEASLTKLCIETHVVDSGTRSSNSYKETVEKIACWVDGFIRGGGGHCRILTGIMRVKIPSIMDVNTGFLIQERRKSMVIIMIVPFKQEDQYYATFVKELDDVLNVASVHSL